MVTPDSLKKRITEGWGISFVADDTRTIENVLYICTRKAAELFGTTYHNFCNEYPRRLLKSGTHRVVLGRHKYYNASELLNILSDSINQGKTVFEICGLMSKKKKKKENKTRKKR